MMPGISYALHLVRSSLLHKARVQLVRAAVRLEYRDVVDERRRRRRSWVATTVDGKSAAESGIVSVR